ncbi:23S rRNA (pseudouridine(1915)-N(3))-methyltransferase RlmH [bacterium]|nr:23S rRNA (pseudouridine(1915)-N(3))-methyltransferase RlmH [bacterium]
MRLSIVGIGGYKSTFLQEGESEFLKRLRRYCPIHVRWVDHQKVSSHRSAKEILRLEGKLLLDKIPDESVVVALDRRGKHINSEDFSKRIGRWQNHSVKEVVFIIGGSIGLDPAVLKRADLILSFSEMTFTHEMIRLLLFEQLYRAFTILRGEYYHK